MATDSFSQSSESCKACREAVHGDHGPPLKKLMQSTSQDAILYRCEVCGACWLNSDDENKVIPADDARLDFPEAFSDERPGNEKYYFLIGQATNTFCITTQTETRLWFAVETSNAVSGSSLGRDRPHDSYRSAYATGPVRPARLAMTAVRSCGSAGLGTCI